MTDRELRENLLASQGVAPCLFCGERCGSQLENLEPNQDPWPYCSACDPDLDEEGDRRQRVFTFYPADPAAVH